MPKPDSKNVTKNFWRMKAKDICKDDRIMGLSGARVTNNEKNSYGDRVITLTSYGRDSRRTLTLIAPKKATFSVSRSKRTRPKKK